ncbi:MAG: hypothetical protein ACE5GE_16960, partial [Phycisphaerae bacterium]
MRSAIKLSHIPVWAVAAVFASGSLTALAQTEPQIDAGYLDFFELTDGRTIDVGANGGGLENDPNTNKIFVNAQPSGVASDGRLTGTVHGKFRVVNLLDQTGEGFINGADLDSLFDVSWQVVGWDKNLGPGSAFFVPNQLVGPEGSVPPWGTQAVNLPPVAGGTASIFNLAGCDAGGLNPGSGSNFCSPFAVTGSYTGFIDYTFPVSIPGTED